MLVGFGKTMVDHSNPTLDAHASNQRKLVDPKTFCFPIHTYMCYIQYIYYILMFIRCVFVHIMFNVHIQQYNYPFFRRIYIHTCRHVFLFRSSPAGSVQPCGGTKVDHSAATSAGSPRLAASCRGSTPSHVTRCEQTRHRRGRGGGKA